MGPPGKMSHVAAFLVASLEAASDPNGHADMGRCLCVRAATQIAQNGRTNASI
jgi:hypothetical protein